MANDKDVTHWLKKYSLEEALDDVEKFKTAADMAKEQYTPISQIDSEAKTKDYELKKVAWKIASRMKRKFGRGTFTGINFTDMPEPNLGGIAPDDGYVKINKRYVEGAKGDVGDILFTDRPKVYHQVTHELTHTSLTGNTSETMTELLSAEVDADMARDGDKNHEAGLYDMLWDTAARAAYVKAEDEGRMDEWKGRMDSLHGKEFSDKFKNYLDRFNRSLGDYYVLPYAIAKEAIETRGDNMITDVRNSQKKYKLDALAEAWKNAKE